MSADRIILLVAVDWGMPVISTKNFEENIISGLTLVMAADSLVRVHFARFT